MLGVDLEALEGLAANVPGVFDSGFRSLREGVLPQRPGEIEMPFGVSRIGCDRATGIELGVPVVDSAHLVIALVLAEIDCRSRGFPERLIALRIGGDCGLVMPESSS